MHCQWKQVEGNRTNKREGTCNDLSPVRAGRRQKEKDARHPQHPSPCTASVDALQEPEGCKPGLHMRNILLGQLLRCRKLPLCLCPCLSESVREGHAACVPLTDFEQ
jgi:hypothetical protein